jgi:adenylate cyclase
MVTHDNRILDVADRIIHLEDGKLSTFSDAVIANTQQMMSTLADMREKEDIDQVISGLDETEFNNLLQTMTDEARRFLETMALGRDRVFGSMMERSLFAFTRRIREMLNADRASLFLVDHENQSLLLRITEGLPDGVEIRIPIGTGIAGAVAESGESIRIPDAYSDPRFNPDVDRKFNYKTRSILCLPIADSEGTVFAVAQLLNRKDGQPWEASDEQKFSSFIDSLGVILQTIQTLSSTK